VLAISIISRLFNVRGQIKKMKMWKVGMKSKEFKTTDDGCICSE